MLVVLIFLCAYGAIMVFSATAYQCSITEEYNNDSFFMLKSQVKFMLAGFALMLFLQLFSYRILNNVLAVVLYLSGIASVFLLKTPLGVTANGATRWVKLGALGQFQVSEWVKVCVIVFLSGWLCTKGE